MSGKKNLPEILAPAGGPEQVKAAVLAGADAVYLGLDKFNARRNAENFTDQAFLEAAAFCHERDVKVYAAVNILIKEDELADLSQTAELLCRAGTDGVIVQDLAAARILRQCSDLPLHASTQMTIHNRAGLRALEELGFCRYVPARELTLAEIAELAKSTDMQTEVFVHGALCMSVSGCCYLSAMLGGRSGNRGLCAQACRLPFTCNGRSHALSLKDLSAIGHIGELRAAGVDSLKIEGRMKRPEYVAAAVTACKNARDGLPYDEDTLRRVFSRSGFTDGYLTGKRDLSMFGFRTREDVAAADEKLLSAIRESWRKETPRVPLSAELTIGAKENRLTISDGNHTVTQTGRGGEPPKTAPLSAENARRSIEKTGGTPYRIASFRLQNPDGLYTGASALNALRRDALACLAEERRAPNPRTFHAVHETYPSSPHSFSGFALRFPDEKRYFRGDYRTAILPVKELLREPERFLPDRDKIVAELPALFFPFQEEDCRRQLQTLREYGFTRGLCENIGGLRLLREEGFCAEGGFGMNLMNSAALAACAQQGLTTATLSIELRKEAARAIRTDLRLRLAVYGFLPLMKLRACPLQSEKGCAGCPGEGVLTDRKGMEFRVLCEDKRFSVLYNSVPLDLLAKDFSFADEGLLYFTGETRETCRFVYDCAKAGKTAAARHTTGLFEKTLY